MSIDSDTVVRESVVSGLFIGKFDEIDYSLKYDDIVRYKKSTEPEFSEFFLITQLPEDLTIKAYEIIYKEQ